MSTIWIDCILASVATLFAVAFLFNMAIKSYKHTNNYGNNPSDGDFDHQVRVVELENGMYAIRVWDRDEHEWKAPVFSHLYDTLEEALHDKAYRIKSLHEDDGYRFKRFAD